MTENMTQFKTEGQPAFPVENGENDNSSSSSEGKETNTDQNQSQEGDQNSGADNKDGGEGDKGFADHPRWIERETQWKDRFNQQEKRHADEIENLRKEIESIKGGNKPATQNNDSAPTEVPSWFGGDDKQWKEFVAWNQNLLKGVSESAIKSIDERSTAEQAKIDEATKFFTDEVARIESDKTINPTGDKIDQNKLLKFVMDNDLVDSKGRWNYKAGFLLMKAQGTGKKTAVLDEKKKIAGASASDKRSDPGPSEVTSSEDFKKPGARPW